MAARRPVRSDPMHLLWHYASGEMPDFINGRDGEVGWVRWSHRGLQPLDEIDFPARQKRYILSPKFTLRFNTAFEETVRACADPTRFGKTWMTDELVAGLVALNRMGYAHSFEAWHEGKLAGGAWGVQIGGFITASSMFHRVSNAAKAAYGQTLLHLKARGFTVVDTGMVPQHQVNYGSRYVPRWQFEKTLPELLKQPLTLNDGLAPPLLPWSLRVKLPMLRVWRAVRKRMHVDDDMRVAPSAAPADVTSDATSDAPGSDD